MYLEETRSHVLAFVLLRTMLTCVPRYRYVDTRYAFTEEEEEQRQWHRQLYTDFIKDLRQIRLSRIKAK